MKLKLHDCCRPKRDTAERWCFSWQTPVQPFSCYTPPLSSRLIKNFTMASHNFHHLRKISAKNVCLFLFPLRLHCSFSPCSSTRVLWPSLELNELRLIIKGISGVEFLQWCCCILQALWLFLVFEMSVARVLNVLCSHCALCVPHSAIRGT